MTYVIRVFQLAENGPNIGKYLDPLDPTTTVDQWLEAEADMGFDLDSLTDIVGQRLHLRAVVKREDG